jgi:hypothetical protein
LDPAALAADTAYGPADMLDWLVEECGIEPHIPVFDKLVRCDGAFPATDLVYDHRADAYACPGAKMLKPFWRDIARRRPRWPGFDTEDHAAPGTGSSPPPPGTSELAKLMPLSGPALA